MPTTPRHGSTRGEQPGSGPRASSRLVGVARACAATATLLAGTGCSNFQDISTIIDLRILGIMAEPPEIVLDPKTVDATDMTPMVRSTITALVVDPHGQGRPVTYAALACPREIDTVTAATGRNGVVCEHGAATTRDVLDPPGTAETTDGGPAHPIQFPFAASNADLAGAFALDPVAKLGFPLPIVIQLELGAGTESIVATKRVIFAQPIRGHEDQPANLNPVVSTVTVYSTLDELLNHLHGVELPAEPDAPPAATVPLGGHLWFDPGGAVAEPYWTWMLTRDDPPQMIAQEIPAETLRYSFFTTAGTFSPGESSTVVSPLRDNDRVHIESNYTAPSVMPDDPTLTVWIVVRDERGGTSWTTRQIILGEP